MNVPGETQPLTDKLLSDIKKRFIEEFPNHEWEQDMAAMTPGERAYHVQQIGEILRYFHNVPLLDTPVHAKKHDLDMATHTLVGMINASIQHPEPDPNVPEFSCVEREGDYNCAAAEVQFLRTLTHFRTSEGTNADIVTDSNNWPILFRKKLGRSTCLTLCDIRIDGIPYPAGSIATIHLPEPYDETKFGQSKLGIKTFKIEDVQSLGFLRLSRFILPRKYQKAWESFPDDPAHTSKKEHAIMRDLTPQEIAESIAQVI